MSARDDYPKIARYSELSAAVATEFERELRKALDEIDRLRAALDQIDKALNDRSRSLDNHARARIREILAEVRS